MSFPTNGAVLVMDKMDLFTNLMALASADGKFTQEEISFLMVRAEDWGISQEEVEVVLSATQAGETEMTIPDSDEDRIDMLQQMIYLMAVDGELAESEKRICATVSAAMNFSAADFNKIVDSLLADN